MPELPEVETLRLGLESKIIGLKIKNVQILNQKTFQGDPKLVAGKKISNIWRRAKVLGIELDNELTLLIHLKMSGQLILVQNFGSSRLRSNKKAGERFIGGHPTKDMTGEMPNRSTRVIFEFNDESKLYFNDQRKFGWIKVGDKAQVTSDKFLSSLGPEPLEREFTWQQLKENLLKHKSQAIKVAILDQSVVSGVGNIYACETCFNARIDPKTKVSNMTDQQFKAIHKGLVKALSDGVKFGGSSRTHFVNEEGKKGFFLDHAFVYGRESDPCKICKTKIKKIKLGGRGTYYCPSCQK